MLFRKYHIVIFKEGHGDCRNILLRGWLGAGLFLLIAALAGGNIYFFKYFAKSSSLERQLSQSEKMVEEQNTQLINLTSKLNSVQADMARVQQFNSKLRAMMDLDRGDEPGTGLGGPGTENLAKGYLPLLRQELLARKMNAFLKQLSSDAQLEEVRQQELLLVLRKKSEMLAATPSIWPAEGWVSSPFGSRSSPFSRKREFHKGLDIKAKSGAAIQAPAKGVVIFAGWHGSYGKTIVINHGNGITTRYAHMQRYVLEEGDAVTRGDLIGYVGSTGRSTGTHLHYEVMLNGVCVNPMQYILN